MASTMHTPARRGMFNLSRYERIGLAFVLASVLGYSFLPVFTALLRDQGMEPLPIAMWRYTLALPCYWLIAAMRAGAEAEPPGRRLPWLRLLVLGTTFAAAALSAFYGLRLIPAGTYVVIFYTYPAMVAVIGLVFGERLNGWGWAAILLTLAGIALTAPGFADGLRGDNMTGVLLALFNALVVAVYFTASSRILRGYRALSRATAIAVIGAWFVLAIATLVTGTFAFPSAGTWPALVGLALVSTVLPILTLMNGIQRLGATRAALFATIEPLVTACFAFLFIGEAMEPIQWVGGLVIVASMILLQTRGAARAAEPAVRQPDPAVV